MQMRGRGRPFKKGEVHNPAGRNGWGTSPKRAFARDIREAAQVFTDKALATLVAALTAEDASWPARISAASALLDRGHGKPAQPIEGTDKPITWQMIVQQALAIPRDQVKPPAWLEQELAVEATSEKETLN
jgi:hypothetical protein